MKRKFLHALLPGACLAIVAATAPVQMNGQNRDFHTERIVLDDAAGDGGFNSLTLQVPGTGLTANRTLTFPDADGSIVTQASPLVANQILFGGASGQAAQSANLLFDNGTGTFNVGAGNFTVAAATGNLATAGNIQADGTIQSGSSIIIDGTTPGSHSITATAGENLTITPSGGTLFVNAPVFNHGSGLFTVDPGAINYNGGALNVTPVTFSTGSGLFSVDPGSISYNAGLFSVDPGTMSYSGSVFTVPGIFTVTPGPTLTLNGLFTVDPGAMNYNSGAFVVTPVGAFHAAGAASTVGDGTNAEQLEVNGVDGGAIEVDVNGDMDVSGTLTAGTLGLGFTQGSIPFADATGSLDENNGALFWDNANERLGAGTNTPSAVIHGLSTDIAEPAIRGDNVASGVGVAGISDLFGVQGQTATGTGVYAVATGTGTGLDGSSDLGVAATFNNTNAANTNAVVEITNVGSGVSLTVAPGTGGDAIDVNGNILSSGGNVTVDDNLDVTGTVDANTLTDGAGSTITGGAGTFATITGTALPAASTSTDLVTSNAGALETRTVASLAGLVGVSSDATLTGDGTTGSPLGIDLTNANSWTGAQTFSSVDVNGGTVDGTAIGATAPSTGAFTTITGTSSVTLGDDTTPTPGSVILHDNTAANTFTGTLQVTNPLTANRTYTFPDADGTLALVGDIVTNSTLLGDGTGGDPLRINLSNANTWTGTQTFGQVAVLSIATFDADVTLGDSPTDALTANGTFAGATPLAFEGATSDVNETTFAITDPTADRTITFQDASGTVAFLSDITVTTNSTLLGDGTGGDPLRINLSNTNTWTGTQTFGQIAVLSIATFDADVTLGDSPTDALTANGTFAGATPLSFEGATSDVNETTFAITDPTADRTITFQDASGTVAFLSDIAVTTNSTLLGDGTGGDPLRINLSNANTWTGAQTFTSFSDFQGPIGSTVGDLQIGDAFFVNSGGATDMRFDEASIVRNSGAAETIAIDNPGAGDISILVNGAGAVANSRLTIDDGHWTSQQTTAPVGAAAGANVTSAALSNETDVAGLVDITTSGTPAAGAQATITFDAAYGTAPIVVLTPANGAAAGIGAHVARTTAGFTISFIGVPAASTSYQFFYQVIETQ